MNTITKFRGQNQVSKFSPAPKDIIEKSLIMDFIKDIPLESLKKLVNFKEIDFDNTELQIKAMTDERLFDLLYELRYKNTVQYEYELWLDI